MSPYHQFAADLLAVVESADPAALARVRVFLGRHVTAEQVRSVLTEHSLDAAQRVVAWRYAFETWADLEAALAHPSAPSHGVSTTHPFYRIRPEDRSLEVRPPMSPADWDTIFDLMREHRITGLHATGQMTGDALEHLTALDFVTTLDLEGCTCLNPDALRHLARMPHLESLNLTGCLLNGGALRVVRELPALREFYLYHHHAVSDDDLAHLAACDRLERVDLLGTSTGDGVLRALAGKSALRHLKSGDQVTDDGLALLHEFPVFRSWQGGTEQFSLMSFAAEPNHLLLRGALTGAGLSTLSGLDGLFSLNLDDGRLAFSTSDLAPLGRLPHLACLGVDATDDLMPAVAALPHLRHLMCQDTTAGDAGFIALSRSLTLEYIWGRRCYNLNGPGFAAFSRMPSLRGLSVSCKNVDDAAISTLPDFPALTEFMPMDFTDHAFRHIAHCPRLEAVWCMYCRETGDAATTHLAALPNLKTYYAGQTHITDRSLEILSGIPSLESVSISACPGVTNRGVAQLAALPRLRELTLGYLRNVTRSALPAIPSRVRVNFEF